MLLGNKYQMLLLMGFFSVLVLFDPPQGFSQEKKDLYGFFDKEVLHYDIKKFGLHMGDATLEFQGREEIEKCQTILITFRAEAFNFLDEEKIYLDPEIFLPVRIDRDLNIFGKKEKIREEYDQESGSIKITKRAGNKEETFSIEKEGKVDNIYAFIFRYRYQGDFQIGENLKLRLPTKDVTVKLINKTKLKISGQTFDAYYMQSDSKEYRLWFDPSSRKIPLKIDGALGLAKVSLVYHP